MHTAIGTDEKEERMNVERFWLAFPHMRVYMVRHFPTELWHHNFTFRNILLCIYKIKRFITVSSNDRNISWFCTIFKAIEIITA